MKKKNEIATGDWNAHDEMWNPKTKSETHGEDLAESLHHAEARVMNTGEATRMKPRTIVNSARHHSRPQPSYY